MEDQVLFWRDGDAFVGTILIQGGWNPDEANGGAVLALLGHCLEDVPSLTPMTLSRFTADLMRPVPLGRPLHVAQSIIREGKKIQIVEQLLTVDGVVHVRTSALRLRDADLTALPVPASTSDARPAAVMAPPEGSRTFDVDPRDLPGFLRGIDLRRADRPGQSTGCWVRQAVPVVAEEPIRDTSRLVLGFDFSTLIGVDINPEGVTMINPDVSGHVLRRPTGEWTAITGDTRFNPQMGRGVSSATLSDLDGPFAFVTVSQLVQPR